MYNLNGILVGEDKLDDEQIDRLIENVNKILICYDIKRLKVELKDFKFILDVKDALG